MRARQANGDYYRQRAMTEWVRACESSDPRVVACHLELARRYEALAQESEPAQLTIPMLAA